MRPSLSTIIVAESPVTRTVALPLVVTRFSGTGRSGAVKVAAGARDDPPEVSAMTAATTPHTTITAPASASHRRCSVMHRDPDTPADLKERLDAERRGTPFAVFRDATGTQHLITLDPLRPELTVGRAQECAIRIDGDNEVSRLHAVLTRRGGSWTVDDSGVSRNGTFVNGERLRGHHKLRDRDVVRVGATELRFFDPSPESTRTVTAHAITTTPEISPAQRKILLALCAPYKDRRAYASPPSNEQIAAELVLSVDGVKSQLRALFAKFGLDDLPRAEKRTRLVEEVFARGVIRDSDLGDARSP
jgi:pSer/pThr/pTyr-binding forkhead associated (FHA) protein